MSSSSSIISRFNRYNHEQHQNNDSFDGRRILSDADIFITQNNLHHLRDVLRKGALLAYDPPNWETIEGLTPEEKEIIHSDEEMMRTGKGGKKLDKHFSRLMLYAMFSSFYFYPMMFSYPVIRVVESEGGLVGPLRHYISSIWIACLFLGCLCAPFPNQALGRRRTLLVASSMTVVSATMYSIYCFDPEAYLLLSHASNLMAGLGNGLAICTVPVLIAETSPAKIRKLISALFWFSMSSGQMMIFCLRIEVASPLLVPTFYLLSQATSLFFVFGICESPLWYMHHGQMERAFASYRRLRGGAEILAARELYQSHIIRMDGGEVSSHTGYVGTTYRLLDLIRVSKIRRNTLGSLAAMVSGGLGLSLAGALLSMITDWYTGAQGVAESVLILASYAPFMMFPSFLGTIFVKKGYSKLLRLYPAILFLLAVMALLFERLGNSGSSSGVMILVTLVSVGLNTLGPGSLPLPYMTDTFPASHHDVGVVFSLVAFFGTQYAAQRFYDSLLWSRAFGFVGRWSLLMLICLIPVLLFMSDWKKKSKGIEDGAPSFGHSIRNVFLLRLISGWQCFRQRALRTPSSEDQEEQPINNGPYRDDDDAISMTI